MPHAAQDCETFSEAGYEFDPVRNKWKAPPGARSKGLRTVGAAAYSEHPSTEVLTWKYDLADGHGMREWRPGWPLPQALFDHVLSGKPIESHNAMFERLVWNNVCVPKYGWPPLPAHVQRCSMATARVQCLPGKLASLGDVLNLDVVKDKDGQRLLDKFSVPRDATKADPRLRIRPEDDPADFERLCEYCAQDVRAEQSASDVMAPMSPAELGFWLVDQEINARGIAVDTDGVADCVAMLGLVFDRYGAECEKITGGLRPTQVQALRGWLLAQGVSIPDMKADTVAATLGPDFTIELDLSDDGDDDVEGHISNMPEGYISNMPATERVPLTGAPRRVLEIRALTGSASVKKVFAMSNRLSRDGRLRNLIVHHGARTGRPTGEGPQPLNLPRSGPKLVECGACARPHRADIDTCPWCTHRTWLASDTRRAAWLPEYVDHVLEIMACRSLDMVETFFGDALLCVSGCLRGMFVAAPGHDMIASDYSSIEAVVLAMLAGEQWRIDAFRRKDPIYLVGASKITGRPLSFYLDYFEQHGEHHPDRQKIGKVSELACLASDTLVWVRKKGSTHSRWKRIVRVTTDDQVYDGTKWVGHEGLIDRGERTVEFHAGIIATPDHQFLAGRTWYRFDAMDHTTWTRAADPLLRLFAPSAYAGTPSAAPVQRVYDLANCGPKHRFAVMSDYGPVLAHNCGFGGWIGSYKAFGSTEDDATIKGQILGWRGASPAIVEFWGGQWRGPPWRRERAELFGVEGAFIRAVQRPGEVQTFRGLAFRYDPTGDKLLLTLPSSRDLTYHSPRLAQSDRNADELSISYMTWNSNPKYGAPGWVRMSTYSGRLTENIVQAVAHDILRYAILQLRLHGYPTVLHVYDEIVVEVPEGFGSIEEVEAIMSRMPPWAADWPITASGGWRAKRYRKG